MYQLVIKTNILPSLIFKSHLQKAGGIYSNIYTYNFVSTFIINLISTVPGKTTYSDSSFTSMCFKWEFLIVLKHQIDPEPEFGNILLLLHIIT